MFEEIAKIIYFHRKKSGLSRKELAELSGVGKTAVFDIEHGKESVRSITLFKVCKALNISLIPESKLMKLYHKEKNAKN